MMITKSRIEDRISHFMTVLPKEAVDILKARWKEKDIPMVFTDEENVESNPYGKIEIAATIKGIHFYNPKNIAENSLDFIVLHEMAHDYYFFTEKHDYNRYKFGEHQYRQRVESEVNFLAYEWLKIIQGIEVK
jgi:hypothetical protein